MNEERKKVGRNKRSVSGRDERAGTYTQLRLDPLGKEDAQEMLAVVDKNGEHYYEAELYRLKGELSLQSRQVKDKSKTSQDKSEVRSPESEVEECFWKAIEIARRQQAKSPELRAVMNLSRLWQQQGKKEETRRMLAEIYSWFTEGFDTVDLQEAKALLDELA